MPSIPPSETLPTSATARSAGPWKSHCSAYIECAVNLLGSDRSSMPVAGIGGSARVSPKMIVASTSGESPSPALPRLNSAARMCPGRSTSAFATISSGIGLSS